MQGTGEARHHNTRATRAILGNPTHTLENLAQGRCNFKYLWLVLVARHPRAPLDDGRSALAGSAFSLRAASFLFERRLPAHGVNLSPNEKRRCGARERQ